MNHHQHPTTHNDHGVQFSSSPVQISAAQAVTHSLRLCTPGGQWARIERDGTLRISDADALQRYADQGGEHAGLARLMLRAHVAGLSVPG